MEVQKKEQHMENIVLKDLLPVWCKNFDKWILWILLLSIVTFILEKAIRIYIVSETIIFAFQLAPFILMAIAVILGIVLATNILIGYCKKLKDRA